MLPNSFTPSSIPKELKIMTQTNTCTPLITAALFVIAMSGINKTWYINKIK